MNDDYVFKEFKLIGNLKKYPPKKERMNRAGAPADSPSGSSVMLTNRG